MNVKKMLILGIAIILLGLLLLASKMLDSKILENAGTQTHFHILNETTEPTTETTIPETSIAETTTVIETETIPNTTVPRQPIITDNKDNNYVPQPMPPITTQPPAVEPDDNISTPMPTVGADMGDWA